MYQLDCDQAPGRFLGISKTLEARYNHMINPVGHVVCTFVSMNYRIDFQGDCSRNLKTSRVELKLGNQYILASLICVIGKE